MTPTMLRHLWHLVEQTQPQILLRLDDLSLVRWVVQQFSTEQNLSPQEASVVNDYVARRVSLIRDLASQRH